ncbi:MAG: peptidylprolyl isomerase [Aureliella sp.]
MRQEKTVKRNRLVRCFVGFAICLGMAPVGAQTPWETAPAKPADLPPATVNKYSPPVNKLPLPPPPTQTSQLSTPGYVSLPQARSQSVNKPVQALASDEQSLIPPNIPFTGQQNSPKDIPGGGINLPLPNLPPPSTGAPSAMNTIPAAPAGASNTALLDGTKRPQDKPAGYSSQAPNMVGDLGIDSNAVEIRKLEAGTLVAVVGEDHILAGDLAAYVEPIIEDNRSKLRPGQEAILREQIIRQVLKSYIEVKAMYQEFFRDAGGGATPDKLIEMKKQVTTRAAKIFFEKQVPVMMKNYEAKNWQELEAKLRGKSMSLRSMQSTFVEQVLSNELERKYIPDDFEISRAELLDYYNANREKWDEPAKARWQQLTIRKDRHENDMQQVEILIKELGNKIFLGGQSFESVAKQYSEGWAAAKGGAHDWTNRGSLKSKALDETIFTIELGRLSKVVTDDIGMHIVKVIERTEQRRKPFTEAQTEIRKELSSQKRKEEIAKFRKKVLSRTAVWSLWPKDLAEKVPHARLLTEAIEAQSGQVKF